MPTLTDVELRLANDTSVAIGMLNSNVAREAGCKNIPLLNNGYFPVRGTAR